jgi:hypothetical protein
MAIISRNAQGYLFGLTRQAGATTGTLNGTLQQASLLQDLVITTDTFGEINNLRVAGQNVLCSNQPANLAAFAPNAMVEGHRSLGIPLDSQQTVSIDYSSFNALGVAANSVTSGAIGTDPISRQQVIPTNSLGRGLDFCVGMGSVIAGAGAAWTLTCTVQRPVMLGRLVIAIGQNPNDVTIRSITVNNIELLSGAAGAAGEFGALTCTNTQTDNDGNTIAYPAGVNDTISIQGFNYNAAATVIGGTILLLPAPFPMSQVTGGSLESGL